MIQDFIILGVLILLSAFFSGIETALMSVSQIKVQALVKQRRQGSAALKRIKEHPKKLIITILIGNNLVNIGAAAFATVLFTNLFGSGGVGIATGVMTFLILIFGEITPKTYATQNAERVSLAVAKPIEMLITLLSPLVYVMMGISHVLHKIMGSEDTEELSEEELSTVVTMGVKQGVLDPEAGEMMQNIIEFQDTEAGEIMTRQAQMKVINGNLKVENAIDFVVQNKFSRYPVYEGDDENIIGVLDVDDVLRCAKHKELSQQVKELVHPITFVPETKKIDDLLAEFEGKHVPMAIVVNEYGDVEGLVTMDDILEEIVGDIFDKSKKATKYLKRVSKNVIEVDPTIPTDDLNKALGLKLNEEEYDTLAGFIQDELQRIPEKGEKIKIDRATIEIEKVSHRKIIKVKILMD